MEVLEGLITWGRVRELMLIWAIYHDLSRRVVTPNGGLVRDMPLVSEQSKGW